MHRQDLAENFVWAVDKLPQRTREMKKMLDATYDRPRAFYVHCEAGCDRTGEFCGSYRLENLNFTMADAWQANIKVRRADAARAPLAGLSRAAGHCAGALDGRGTPHPMCRRVCARVPTGVWPAA